MSSTNVAIVDGYLGMDSKLVFSQAGFAFLNFSVAVKDSVKVGDRYEDRTSWVDCKALGKRAEGLAKILYKGTFVVVSGKLQQERWEDKDGGKRSKIVLLVDNVSLGPKPANAGGQRSGTESGPSDSGYDENQRDDGGDTMPF